MPVRRERDINDNDEFEPDNNKRIRFYEDDQNENEDDILEDDEEEEVYEKNAAER